MSYTPTNWRTGDTVTSTKLNKMEQGIANAGGGGGVLVVHDNNGTLDKTWQEIHDAMLSVGAVVEVNGGITLFTFTGTNGIGAYHVDTASGDEYYTDSTDGYPIYSE